MSTDVATTETPRMRTYGNASEQRIPGVLGLSLAASIVAGAAAMLVLLLLWVGGFLIPAGLVLLLAVPAVAMVQSKDRNGRSPVEKKIAQRMFKKAKKNGYTSYKSGPASQLPDGTYRAPGLLSNTQPIEGHTTFGEPFVMLWDPSLQTGSVFLATTSKGVGLMDQEQVDHLVDAWAAFQRDAGGVASQVQISVTTQTTADPGERLKDAVQVARTEAGASETDSFAREVINEVVEDLSQWTPRVEQWITMTFSGRASQDGSLPARSVDELVEEIASIIPGFLELASASGGGAVELMHTSDLTDLAHIAYNPHAAASVERARLTSAGTGLTWDEIGPTYHEVRETPMHHLEHSDAYSKSWQLRLPPSGTFRETGLQSLLGPDDRFMQKRVTVFYRPADPETSQKEVNAQVTNAEFAINQRNQKVTAADRLAVRKAHQASEEQTLGASMVKFSLMITVTVPSVSSLPQAEAAIRQKGSQGIQLRLRDCPRNDDSAFAMSLGLGVVPTLVATFPESVRKAL
ncbi:SCO6880 family protein [Kocuria carniphila]|uniref:SCO6880 family protein n=1 Tax=Kocuria carniphila TaxID=262208 RepID=UPI00269F6E29